MEKDETRQDFKDMQVWDVLLVLLVEGVNQAVNMLVAELTLKDVLI